MGTVPPVLAAGALDLVREYRWPGNIRELRYVLAAALTQHPVAVLEADHLSPLLAEQARSPLDAGAHAATLANGHDFDRLVNAYERGLLEDALRRFATQKDIAAHLELTEARLHRLLKRHNLLGWKVERPKAGNDG
jgi:DNA-binding NtrC family response regulator